MKLPKILMMFLFLFVVASTGGCAQQTIVRTTQMENLTNRWEQAGEEARQFSDGFWIGYSIERLMEKNSTIGNMSWRDGQQLPALEMIISGETEQAAMTITDEDDSVHEAAERALRNQRQGSQNGEKVLKQVAILFYFPNTPADIIRATDLKISNLSLHVDLDDKPLVWLGTVGQQESVRFLSKAYSEVRSEETKEGYITAIGLHRITPDVRNFLTAVVNSDDSDDLRETAVFWLGQQEEIEMVELLLNITENDQSANVREAAVFALSQHRTGKAQDALIDLAKSAKDAGVREQAVFWLGQSDNPEAVELLVLIVQSDPNGDVQQNAVFALSQHNTEEATRALIDLARYEANSEIRERAIFWLGQKASELAKEALKDVAENDPDSDIQEEAVFALSQLKENAGVPILIELAREHPNIEVRKSAIFWLGQSSDPRATNAIIDMVRNR